MTKKMKLKHDKEDIIVMKHSPSEVVAFLDMVIEHSRARSDMKEEDISWFEDARTMCAVIEKATIRQERIERIEREREAHEPHVPKNKKLLS